MRRLATIAAFLWCISVACKENTMANTSVFPPVPVPIPFKVGYVYHLFPVLRQKSIGLVYDEQWAVARIEGDKIDLDKFPKKEFDIPTAKALPQKDPDLLYVKTPKSVALLDLKRGRVTSQFFDLSRGIGCGVDRAKIVDYKAGIAFTIFSFDGPERDIEREFVLADIRREKRLKDLPIPDYARQFPVYFTPSCVFYRRNWETPWAALDNDLNEVAHPLVDLLNKDPEDKVFAVVDDNMLVSEERKHALILTYSKAVDKDMVYLARWYGDPEVVPVPIEDAAVADGRRLMKTPNSNTISPSGLWAYFATDGGRRLKDTHYIVYLDPAQPAGFLGPIRLAVEGPVECASWMTEPEGLVLYTEGALIHLDLSGFDPAAFAAGQVK